MNTKILEFIKSRQVTFFLGAGTSMVPPSCLPSWWQINHIILDSLADEVSYLFPDIRQLVNFVKQREDEGKLPPEFVAELITNRIGESYFEVLQALEGDTPNLVHLWLATLAKAGLIKSIITTNFDTLIEQAFQVIGAPLRVFVNPHDYEPIEFPEDFANIAHESPCNLFKLHGTATQPKTCVDTLAQRKQGLHSNILNTLKYLGSQTFWVILGYSGADLEADANYLGIRARMNNSLGFSWLHLPDRGPLPAVAELAELYGQDRGIIEFGVLPEWLDKLEEILPPHMNRPEIIPLSNEEIQRIKSVTEQSIVQHASIWAKARGTSECAMVLADIAISAGFHEEARSVFLKLLEDIEGGELTSFGLGIVFQGLGEIARHFGENRDALTYYQDAVTYFRDAQHTEGIFSSLQGVAQILRYFGDYPQAEKTLQGYLEYSRNTGDNEAYVHGLIDLGNFCRETGELHKGLEILNEAYPLAIQQGLELLRAHILLGQSMLEMEFGNPIEAEEKATEAKNVYTRLGEDSFLSETFRHLAYIYWKRGEVDHAFELLDQAKISADLVGNKSRIIRSERMRGEFLTQIGNYFEAETVLKNTVEVAENIGDLQLLLVTWQSLGLTYQMQGLLDESYSVYQNALKIAEKFELDIQAAGLRNNLGIVAEQREHFEEALTHYQAAIEVFTRTGQLESIAGTQGNIANIYYRLGNYEESRKYYQKIFDIFEELQDIGGILRTVYNMANVIYQSGDIQQANEHYEKAIQLAEQYERPGLKDYFQLNYANVLFQLEDFLPALDLYTKTYLSSSDREDYLQAGMAIYYAGLTYLKLFLPQQAIEAIEEAISIWTILDEELPQIIEAQNLLNSLQIEHN